MNNTIPKIIHYIWLSDEPVNSLASKCIDSWKRFAPEYEIRRWRLSDFDIESMPVWVSEAIEAKKWAFATDYLRLYVIEKYGGVYFDSDVFLMKPIDSIFTKGFVSAKECYGKKSNFNSMEIQAAVMGSEPHHSFVQKCMQFYEDNHFTGCLLPDGSVDEKYISPEVYAKIAYSMGLNNINEYQCLDDDVELFPTSVISPCVGMETRNTSIVHLCNGSWRDYNDPWLKPLLEEFRNLQITTLKAKSGDVLLWIVIVPWTAIMWWKRMVRKLKIVITEMR